MSRAFTQGAPRKAWLLLGHHSEVPPTFSVGIDTHGSKISKQWNENGAASVFTVVLVLRVCL